MSQSMMSCEDERQFGAELAKELHATQTQAAFENKNSSPEAIMKAAVAELGQKDKLDVLISNVLKGPPHWAQVALRYIPDCGPRRDELLKKAAEDPRAAFYTLRYVPDVGQHRDALLKKVAEDPGWAQMAQRYISNLGSHQKALAEAVESPPAEVGWGYNTYFVNQTGVQLWVMYNTGERGSDGSITGPTPILKNQNIGYGRGGTCISELKVSKSEPANWQSPVDLYWGPTPIDGCLSWGFHIVMDVTGQLYMAEAYPWAEGQPGMPGQYPPSSGG